MCTELLVYYRLLILIEHRVDEHVFCNFKGIQTYHLWNSLLTNVEGRKVRLVSLLSVLRARARGAHERDLYSAKCCAAARSCEGIRHREQNI